jgi:hypothetical protein
MTVIMVAARSCAGRFGDARRICHVAHTIPSVPAHESVELATNVTPGAALAYRVFPLMHALANCTPPQIPPPELAPCSH